jgi:hypothetical protein
MAKQDLPVLVIAFNRPSHVKQLLSKLTELQIKEVYVSIDGPRNLEEKKSCDEVLGVVRDFSEELNLKVIFRDYNLGCGLGVTSALDWFFSKVQFGVILEDDCVPNDSFFDYFESYFANQSMYVAKRVTMASAHNPFRTYKTSVESNYFLIQGWGTSRANWEKVRKGYFRFSLPRLRNASSQRRSASEAIFWWSNATRARLAKVDTWDSMYCDRMWNLGNKCLIPATNLIENNGFGSSASHTKDPAGSIFVEISTALKSTKEFDELLKEKYFRIRPRHLFTPLFRIILDLIFFKRRPIFESILLKDCVERHEL